MRLLALRDLAFVFRIKFVPTPLLAGGLTLAYNTDNAPSSRGFALLLISFYGIFIYGLLAALPGSVLPTLERSQFLPGDSAVGNFFLINATGAGVADAVSGR